MATAMAWASGIRERRRQPEIMDQPGLGAERHAAALRGLERINTFSRSAAILWPAIERLARQLERPVQVLDVATGAGDIPIQLARRAQRTGISIRLDACDISDTALTFARERAATAGTDVHFFHHDALSGPFPREYDAVVSSLFLHHLESIEAIDVLRRMAAATRRIVLVNDLRRSRAGWWLAWFGTRLLTTSRVAHVDGPRSVEGAFTTDEARELADRAGLTGAAVERRWPCRWLLSWERPRE